MTVERAENQKQSQGQGNKGSGGQGYGGHVEPGGPPAIRRVRARSSAAGEGSDIEIRKLSVGGMDNNVYVLLDRSHTAETDSPNAVVIDAANEPQRVLTVLDDCRVGAIVTSHRHADHWQGLAGVAEATGAPTLAGADDAGGIGYRIDERLDDGDRIEVGAIDLEVIHTPGHTVGSVCLLLRTEGDHDHHLFTGDTLFPGGPGNTFGDAEAFTTIMRSLRQKVFRLPDSTWVYPGHGDDTTLGAERPHLDAWDERKW